MFMSIAYNGNRKSQEELVSQYIPMVKQIAGRLIKKAPGGTSIDDLISAGMLGLAEAVGKFDKNRQEEFVGLVRARVHGAMIDEIRMSSPLSRNKFSKSVQLTKSINDLRHSLGRQPSEQEIADRMGLSTEAYHELLLQLQEARVLSHSTVQKTMDNTAFMPDLPAENPQNAYLHEELKVRLSKAIASLSEKEQHVLSMYYKHDKQLKEIGTELGVSESRACQIRTEAVFRLRAIMEEE